MSTKPISVNTASATRPPATVWILTFLLSLLALVSIVGSFLFSFPLGNLIGYTAGTLLIAAGIGYVTIVWRLRRGERAVWTAALVLPIAHTLMLNTLDLVLYGAIPSEDYPFMGIVLVVVLLLLLPVTRRFFTK